MAAVVSWNARNSLLLSDAAQELFRALGGEPKAADWLEEREPVEYALPRQLLQDGLDSGGLTRMLLTWVDHDDELQRLELEPEDWQQAGVRVTWESGGFPNLIAGLTFDEHAVSEKLADLFADLEVARCTERPLPVRAYLQRRDVDRLRLRLPLEAKQVRRPSPELRVVVQKIAARYPEGAKPGEKELVAALQAELPAVSRKKARDAFKKYAPRLWGTRGHRSKI